MTRQNIVQTNRVHRTLRTKWRNSIGDVVTLTLAVKADSPTAAPVIDRIWTAATPHARLEPAPMGMVLLHTEEFDGDIPPVLVEPTPPAPRQNPPNPAATAPKPATITPQPQAQQPRKKLIEQED